MSTELFLNTNCRLSKQQQFKIKECFKEKYVRDVSFRYIGKVKNVEGVNYYFDSMWTPFLKPLNEFKNPKVDNYSGLNSIFETIREVVSYLLNENHIIKLFFAPVEDKEFPNKGKARLKFSDLNEFRCFEWGTIYEIYMTG
mgnify:FL=1